MHRCSLSKYGIQCLDRRTSLNRSCCIQLCSGHRQFHKDFRTAAHWKWLGGGPITLPGARQWDKQRPGASSSYLHSNYHPCQVHISSLQCFRAFSMQLSLLEFQLFWNIRFFIRFRHLQLSYFSVSFYLQLPRWRQAVAPGEDKAESCLYRYLKDRSYPLWWWQDYCPHRGCYAWRWP